ncbi:MAG: hypothetical protein RL514_2761 [Verrucomicrobiota bacterium]|jgi:glycosyltransferase involved in cell wall biosynthesis
MKNRFTIEWEDRLRQLDLVRWGLCRAKLATVPTANDADPQSIARAIHHLCGAARLATNHRLLLGIEAQIAELVRRLDRRPIRWVEFEPTAESNKVEKGLLLKPWVSEREKGVAFVSFEYQWQRLLSHCDLEKFAQRYLLVVSPTWSPPHSLLDCVFPAAYPGPVFTLLSNPADLEIFPRLGKNNVMVPLYASSWVNPSWYEPVPFAQKNIDLLMLANFGKYKRHHALFRALQDMPRSLKVVLIGTHNGKRSRAVLMAEAEAFGVADRFELRESVTDAALNEALRHAKVSLILSRREGSCVAVVESMFANTPVGLYEDAAIGSRVFINAATGCFLQHANLGAQLTRFIAEAERYTPRQWVMDNEVSCFGSTRKLNQQLKEHQLAAGQAWTQDIAPHHWRPDPRLIETADRVRLRSEFEEVRQRFGVEIGMPKLYEA